MTLASCIFPIKDGQPLKSLRSVRPMLLRLQPFDAQRNGLFDSEDEEDSEMEASLVGFRVNMKLPDEACSACHHCGTKIKAGSIQIDYQQYENSEIVSLHGSSCASAAALDDGYALHMMWAIEKHLKVIPGSSLEGLLRNIHDQINEGLSAYSTSGSETLSLGVEPAPQAAS